MKYVMFVKKDRLCDHYVPVIFPNFMVHADVAAALRAKGKPLEKYKVHSAGEISPLDMTAHGKSDTLNVESDPQDTSRIRACDYGGCFG